MRKQNAWSGPVLQYSLDPSEKPSLSPAQQGPTPLGGINPQNSLDLSQFTHLLDPLILLVILCLQVNNYGGLPGHSAVKNLPAMQVSQEMHF